MTESGPSTAAEIDLIVATVGRTTELATLMHSVRSQQGVPVRMIIVDQNPDDRITPVIGAHANGIAVLHLRAPVGVSHARNDGLRHATAPLVAWPDDDCAYPIGVLEEVIGTFRREPTLDVLVGRIQDPSGQVGVVRSPVRPVDIDARSVWRYASAPTFFARLEAARRIGDWNERLGPGGGTQWDAGEDTEWLVRAVTLGLRARHDPGLVVHHVDPFLTDSAEALKRARRYGRCTTYVALSQGYGLLFVTRLVVRAAGGALVSLAKGRVTLARIHAAALTGRLEGLLWVARERRHAA